MPSKESLERRLQVGDEVLVPAQIVQYVEPRSCGVQIKLGAGGRATHLVWVNESELLLKADLLDEAIREKEIRTLTEAERMFGLPGEFKNWVQARLAQLREGKT